MDALQRTKEGFDFFDQDKLRIELLKVHLKKLHPSTEICDTLGDIVPALISSSVDLNFSQSLQVH